MPACLVRLYGYRMHVEPWKCFSYGLKNPLKNLICSEVHWTFCQIYNACLLFLLFGYVIKREPFGRALRHKECRLLAYSTGSLILPKLIKRRLPAKKVAALAKQGRFVMHSKKSRQSKGRAADFLWCKTGCPSKLLLIKCKTKNTQFSATHYSRVQISLDILWLLYR